MHPEAETSAKVKELLTLSTHSAPAIVEFLEQQDQACHRVEARGVVGPATRVKARNPWSCVRGREEFG